MYLCLFVFHRAWCTVWDDTPQNRLTDNMLRLVDTNLFMHACVSGVDTRAILRKDFNKHETMLSRVTYEVGPPNGTV
jgi:hypothetical protein